MAADFETRACPKCGLATARATRGLVLCAACGAVTPVPRGRARRAAAGGPVVPRRKLVARAAAGVATAIAVIISGLALAFRAYGSVNVRYLAALAALLATVGAATVAALAWAAADPKRPPDDSDGCDDPGVDVL